MNVKRIASSVATLATVGSVLAGATFALFSDQATSTGNTFSTGNASLLISDELAPTSVDYTETILGMDFDDPKIAPGFDEEKIFWLKNDSSSFGLDVTVDLANIVGGPTLNSLLLVQFVCDSGNDGLGTGTDVLVPALPQSVDAWDVAVPANLLANLPQGAEMDCMMSAELPSSVTTGQDESLTFDVEFDGLQVVTP